MARNEEKNFTILNRLYLAQQEKESKDKNPERPPLGSLHTAAQVKKWIPGIKWEINFCLHHLSGIRNYPDYKIREFQERVDELTKEYKRWIKRALELDPDTIGVPGALHAYHSKKVVNEARERRLAARQINPNGSTRLYYNYQQIQQMQYQQQQQIQRQKDQEQGVEYDEDEYPSEGGTDYFEQMGLEGEEEYNESDAPTEGEVVEEQVSQDVPPETSADKDDDDDDVFETPLAKRPEGYVSDEEAAAASAVPAYNPNDPQNQPLSFSAKKRDRDDFVYQYKVTKPYSTAANKNTSSSDEGGLSSLLGYGSEEEEED